MTTKLGTIEDLPKEYIEKLNEAGVAPLWPMMSCLLYTSPSPRDLSTSRMPSSA